MESRNNLLLNSTNERQKIISFAQYSNQKIVVEEFLEYTKGKININGYRNFYKILQKNKNIKKSTITTKMYTLRGFIKKLLIKSFFNELLDYKQKKSLEKCIDDIDIPKLQRVPIGENKVFTKKEIALIIDYSKSPMKQLYKIAYFTGARVSEITNMRFSDMRLENSKGHIEILGKGKKIRILEITKDFYYELKNLRRYQSQEFVFTTYRYKPYSTSYINKHLKKIFKKIDCERKINFHMFRHTFATLMVGKTDVKKVSRYLGHSSVLITLEMYVHGKLGSEDIFNNLSI